MESVESFASLEFRAGSAGFDRRGLRELFYLRVWRVLRVLVVLLVRVLVVLLVRVWRSCVESFTGSKRPISPEHPPRNVAATPSAAKGAQIRCDQGIKVVPSQDIVVFKTLFHDRISQAFSKEREGGSNATS